jgi:hypothetical protein
MASSQATRIIHRDKTETPQAVTETKTIAYYTGHPKFDSELILEIKRYEADGWRVVQVLPLTYKVGEGPVQDQMLIFRLER